MRVPALLFAALLWALPAQAAPDPAAQAEHQRLIEDMRRLAQRGAWRGVETAYVNMTALEAKGVVLTYEDHFLGAQAARALGQVTNVYDRLARARQLQSTDEVVGWMTEIEAVYGRVELLKDERMKEALQLSADEMPFAPDQRAVVGAAVELATTKGLYKGLLPFGTYKLNGKPFEVKAGGEVVKVIIAPEGAEGRERVYTGRRDGWRIDAGPLATLASDPIRDPKEIAPTGFAGLGARAGIGPEFQLGDSDLCLLLMGGYHGMFLLSRSEGLDSTGNLQTNPVGESSADRMHVGYGWLGASYWPSDNLSVAIGPSGAFGLLKAQGFEGDCLESSGSGCARPVSNEAGLAAVTATDTLFAGGATAGLHYSLADLGGIPQTRWGLSLYGGVYTDTYNLFPWAQLAFTVAPSN